MNQELREANPEELREANPEELREANPEGLREANRISNDGFGFILKPFLRSSVHRTFKECY